MKLRKLKTCIVSDAALSPLDMECLQEAVLAKDPLLQTIYLGGRKYVRGRGDKGMFIELEDFDLVAQAA